MKSIASAVGTLVLVGATLVAGRAGAHPEGHGDDPVANPFAARRAARATATPIRLVAARRAVDPDIAAAFAPFVATGAVATRRDDRFFYVESDGVPDHPLMVGIRAWQQQVPLPQPYTGDNAWPIPLHPRPAKTPASTRNRFLRGAIAVAVNGIPIFNPLNNRGEDSKAIGELDDFGGHCGRADDYHYHVAPVHLEKVVGKGKPVAWALDGYPVYGLVEPDGSPVKPLDACHGHDDPVIGYHYHAADTYPYLIGAFHGEVTERDGQVDPQPRARGVREALPPLKGAEIVGFEFTSSTARKLTYQVGGRQGTVEYVLGADGAVSFRYTDPNGRVKTEDARPRGRGPGQGPPRDGDRPPPRGQDPRRGGGEGPGGPPPGRGDRFPPRDARQPPPPPRAARLTPRRSSSARRRSAPTAGYRSSSPATGPRFRPPSSGPRVRLAPDPTPSRSGTKPPTGARRT